MCRALEKSTALQSLSLGGECAAVFPRLFCVVFVLCVFEGGLLYWLYLQCSFAFEFACGLWGVHMVCMPYASALTLLRLQGTTFAQRELLRSAERWRRTRPCSRWTFIVSVQQCFRVCFAWFSYCVCLREGCFYIGICIAVFICF